MGLKFEDLEPNQKYVISEINDPSIFKEGVTSGCMFTVFDRTRKDTFRKGIEYKPCCQIHVIDFRDDTKLNKYLDSPFGSCFQMFHQHWVDEGKVSFEKVD